MSTRCCRAQAQSGAILGCAKGGACACTTRLANNRLSGRPAPAVPRGAAIGWFVFQGRPLLYATYLLALALVYVYCVASTAVYRRVREIPRARLVWDVLCIILGADARPAGDGESGLPRPSCCATFTLVLWRFCFALWRQPPAMMAVGRGLQARVFMVL